MATKSTGSLMDRLRATSVIKDAEILSSSKYFTKKDMITTAIPAMNIALSGDWEGGFCPGLTLFAGPSKHFKSLFSLVLAKSYMDKYPDAVMIFYDCEFGTPGAYFDSLGIDKSRILHIPVMDMEDFKFDVMKQLEGLTRGEHVIFVVDSTGNMSSKKEMEDAIEGKSVQDMSRAKQMKSIFRMITPYLNKLDLPMIAVAHIYMCGTENMTILTENGEVLLKDVKTGDVVMTTNGLEPVSAVFQYDNAAVTEIEMEDGSILEFTSGHKFMVDGKWVFVEDLLPGMDLQLKS